MEIPYGDFRKYCPISCPPSDLCSSDSSDNNIISLVEINNNLKYIMNRRHKTRDTSIDRNQTFSLAPDNINTKLTVAKESSENKISDPYNISITNDNARIKQTLMPIIDNSGVQHSSKSIPRTEIFEIVCDLQTQVDLSVNNINQVVGGRVFPDQIKSPLFRPNKYRLHNNCSIYNIICLEENCVKKVYDQTVKLFDLILVSNNNELSEIICQSKSIMSEIIDLDKDFTKWKCSYNESKLKNENFLNVSLKKEAFQITVSSYHIFERVKQFSQSVEKLLNE